MIDINNGIRNIGQFVHILMKIITPFREGRSGKECFKSCHMLKHVTEMTCALADLNVMILTNDTTSTILV